MIKTLARLVCMGCFVVGASAAMAANEVGLLYCVEQEPYPGLLALELFQTEEGTFMRTSLSEELIEVRRTSLTSYEDASGEVQLQLLSRTPLQFEFTWNRDLRILNCHSIVR